MRVRDIAQEKEESRGKKNKINAKKREWFGIEWNGKMNLFLLLYNLLQIYTYNIYQKNFFFKS